LGVPVSNSTPPAYVPHSIEAEQALLGAILVNSAAFDSAEPCVSAANFYEPVHAHLFERFATARREGSAITYTLAGAWLGELGNVDISGMTLKQYLARMAAEATTVVNACDYARQIREHAKQRELITVAHFLEDGAGRGGAKASDLATVAIEQLDPVASEGLSKSSARVSIGDASNEALFALQDRLQNPGKLPGLSCGVSRLLDKKTGGFQRGELIIMAGRPGMGKTALGIASAYKSAASGEPSLFFSLEMLGKRLANRAASFACYGGPLLRVPYFDIEAGTVTDKQAHRFADATRDLRDVELEIEQQSGLSLSQIAARTRRHKQRLAQRGLTLGTVWVDHLGLIKPSANYNGNRVNELAEISGALKVLAKDLDVPIVVLCQLNRMVEARDNKRPTLSDLRDSGAIEQDADLVLMAYREAYYLENTRCNDPTEEEKRTARLGEVINKLELLITKNRSGPTGTLDLFADMPCNYFADTYSGAAA